MTTTGTISMSAIVSTENSAVIVIENSCDSTKCTDGNLPYRQNNSEDSESKAWYTDALLNENY